MKIVIGFILCALLGFFFGPVVISLILLFGPVVGGIMIVLALIGLIGGKKNEPKV